MESDTFVDIPSEGTLYVPIGSTGCDAWMEILGSGWEICEQ